MISSILKKLLLITGPITGTKAWTEPLGVSVDVTGRCNLNCIGCTDHSPLLKSSESTVTDQAVDIPFSMFTRLCDDLSGFRRGSTILFTGEGEPLLHPQLVEMIQYAKARQLQIRLSTNGTLLAGEKSKQLIEAGLDELVLSLWAIVPDHAEDVYQGRGRATLATQLKNLEVLQQIKRSLKSSTPRVVLYHPFNRHSIESPERILEHAQKYEVDFVHFSLLRTRQGRVSVLAPDPNQVEALAAFSPSARKFPVGHNLKDVLLAYQLGEKVWEKTPCYVGWFGFYLTRAGHIQPCKMCRLSLGELDQASLREWWNGQTMRAFRAQVATRKGLLEILKDSDCEYCCYAVANYRMHRRIGWFRTG